MCSAKVYSLHSSTILPKILDRYLLLFSTIGKNCENWVLSWIFFIALFINAIVKDINRLGKVWMFDDYIEFEIRLQFARMLSWAVMHVLYSFQLIPMQCECSPIILFEKVYKAWDSGPYSVDIPGWSSWLELELNMAMNWNFSNQPNEMEKNSQIFGIYGKRYSLLIDIFWHLLSVLASSYDPLEISFLSYLLETMRIISVWYFLKPLK